MFPTEFNALPFRTALPIQSSLLELVVHAPDKISLVNASKATAVQGHPLPQLRDTVLVFGYQPDLMVDLAVNLVFFLQQSSSLLLYEQVSMLDCANRIRQ